jgi:L-fuconolactonase
MSRIDAHQHFWKYDAGRDTWITSEMAVLARDFMPEDLEPLLKKHQFDGCVVVQAAQTPEENFFHLKNAETNSFIKGIIGWADLRSADLEEQLQEYKNYPLIKGFRHVLQGESNRALILDNDFKQGLYLLSKCNFTYDVLIYPDQLIFLEEFLKTTEGIPLVINHLAKPDIKTGNFLDWAEKMQRIAAFENVYCKVSGMVTEADWHNWKDADFEPCLNIVFNAFGADRLLFGSDWPVCNLAGGYDKMIGLLERYTSSLTPIEQAKFWGENAIKFYHLAS